jgi:transposase
MKQIKEELPPDVYAQDVKEILWPLRKNHQDLEQEEHKRLRRLFQFAPRLHQADTLREELTAIFNRAQTMQEAERRLTAWIKTVERLNATCFRPFLKTLSSHWTLIINYFADRITSGFVEGLNNKIRTITRRCYGIRKPSTLFQRLWLDLEARLIYIYATKWLFPLSTHMDSGRTIFDCRGQEIVGCAVGFNFVTTIAGSHGQRASPRAVSS